MSGYKPPWSKFAEPGASFNITGRDQYGALVHQQIMTKDRVP